MRSFLNGLKVITNNPWLTLAMGIILFTSSSIEVYDSLSEGFEHMRIGAHHGVVLLGIYHILKVLPEIFESLSYMHEAGEEE